MYLQGNVNKAIEAFRIANLLLKNTQDPEYIELYLKVTLKLARICALHDFPDTAELLLKKEVIVFSKKMELNPELYAGKAEIIFGYLNDATQNYKGALEHYSKAVEHFKNVKYYEGLYKAYDLAGGASWKTINKDAAIQNFKDALYNVMMAEKANKDKREQRIWDLIKKGLSTKITSAETSDLRGRIEKVE